MDPTHPTHPLLLWCLIMFLIYLGLWTYAGVRQEIDQLRKELDKLKLK